MARQFIDEASAVNAVVETWTKQELGNLKRLAPRATGNLIRELKIRNKYHAGEVYATGFKVLRYGILQEKGVGRGVRMENGVRFENAKTLGALLRRKPNPWISKSITDDSITNLADELVKIKADFAVKKINI